MDTHTIGELLPTVEGYGGRCDHLDAWTGVHQWDGLTYCIHCCEHNFEHRDFVFDLGDGYDTCTLCFKVIGQHIEMPPRRRSGRLGRKAKPKLPKLPKIVLTDCGEAC